MPKPFSVDIEDALELLNSKLQRMEQSSNPELVELTRTRFLQGHPLPTLPFTKTTTLEEFLTFFLLHDDSEPTLLIAEAVHAMTSSFLDLRITVEQQEADEQAILEMTKNISDQV
jgi:hypothetical protein